MASCWCCPTSENLVDLLTRGFSFDQLSSSKLWWYRPDWLLHQEKWLEWEKSPTLHLCALAGIVEDFIPTDGSGPPNTDLHHIIMVTNYITLHKFLAVSAYCIDLGSIVVTTRCHSKVTFQLMNYIKHGWNRLLTAREKCTGKKYTFFSVPSQRTRDWYWCDSFAFSWTQRDSSVVVRGYIMYKSTNSLSFHIYLQKIIHSLHSLSMPLMLNCHCGVNSTVTVLSRTYWVPTARQCVKGLLRLYTICKHNGMPYTSPNPVPLSKSTLQDVHPFTATRIGFTGALYVRSNSRDKGIKLYVFIYMYHQQDSTFGGCNWPIHCDFHAGLLLICWSSITIRTHDLR